MPPLTYVQQVIYKAISAIESSFLGRIKANAKTVVAFVSGKDDRPYHEFFASHKDIYKALPKANVLSVISNCASLVEMGYLTKTSLDGNIYYQTTGKNPFGEEDLLFSQKLSPRKKQLLESICEFVKDYWPTAIENEKANYFGFKMQSHNPQFQNFNWFWITTCDSDAKLLTFKYRETPMRSDTCDPINFSGDTAEEVINLVRKLLTSHKDQFWLSLNENAEFKVPEQPQLTVPRRESSGTKKPIPSNASKEILHFSHFAGDRISRILINDGNNQMDALLSVGEASPFYYDEKTFCPNEDSRRLFEGKKSFDFSMRKWKLVAWSVSASGANQVQRALIINKKTKSIWIVLSIGERKVTCVSRIPFAVNSGRKEYLPKDILRVLFSEQN